MENKEMGKNVQETAVEPEKKNKKEKAKKTVGQEILSWIFVIVGAVAIAMAIRAFAFEMVLVDGNSMRDTLADREIMLVTKPEYIFGAPQVGDIVVCNYPGRQSNVRVFGIQLPFIENTKFVKRVMGIPGDTIKIVDHKVYRKAAGEEQFVLIEEPYLTPERNDDFRTSEMGEVVLGDNEYFVMGDNRDNSNDSRYIGPITREMILGHVQAILFPLNVMRGVH